LVEVFYGFHRASGPIDALGAVKDLARVGVAMHGLTVVLQHGLVDCEHYARRINAPMAVL
jgi:hypothetical protein